MNEHNSPQRPNSEVPLNSDHLNSEHPSTENSAPATLPQNTLVGTGSSFEENKQQGRGQGRGQDHEKLDPRYVFTPTIDIYENSEGLVLKADLPGVSTEMLDLQIQENRLTLFGKVKQTIPEDARLVHQEYQVGDFLRSFILSDHLDYERITAKLTHGVLEVSLPKLTQEKPRRIQIQTDS